ncbi:fluoride efflux transporter FluC [Roseococcus sp. DSY-14]|uniref:fluoride efflux transporter FluC n=1 Tax=Roseococcus sp. DSY-14 TaxID=3369650 RepID=UPI00387AA05A
MNLLAVMAGGALGSAARWGVSLWLPWPWATLLVNGLGSAAIGALAAQGVSGPARLFLVTGVLGGFTTFSAFSLETALLWERAPWQAALYVAASLGLGLGGFALGWWAGR